AQSILPAHWPGRWRRSPDHKRMPMHIRAAIAATALACLPLAAQAQDMAKFPNWEGQWGRTAQPSKWDSTKPPGLGQQAPLTPKYQQVLVDNLKKREEGKDFDPKEN